MRIIERKRQIRDNRNVNPVTGKFDWYIWFQKNKSKRNDALRKQRYGITAERFAWEVSRRNNLCDICGNPPSGKGPKGVLQIDHLHDAEKTFRGMLCGNCNSAISFFREDVETIKKAIEYLRRPI